MIGQWHVHSDFTTGDYTLITPDGQKVDSYPTLKDAMDAMRKLQEESLHHAGSEVEDG